MTSRGPVIEHPLGPRRNAARSATSSGWANRRSGSRTGTSPAGWTCVIVERRRWRARHPLASSRRSVCSSPMRRVHDSQRNDPASSRASVGVRPRNRSANSGISASEIRMWRSSRAAHFCGPHGYGLKSGNSRASSDSSGPTTSRICPSVPPQESAAEPFLLGQEVLE